MSMVQTFLLYMNVGGGACEKSLFSRMIDFTLSINASMSFFPARPLPLPIACHRQSLGTYCAFFAIAESFSTQREFLTPPNILSWCHNITLLDKIYLSL